MSIQIFNKPIPIIILSDFLNSCCQRHNGFIFDTISYRKAEYTNNIIPFIKSCQDYYYPSKQKYVDEKSYTYKSITTIIRQICNYHKIPYITNVVYNHSAYNTVYTIHID